MPVVSGVQATALAFLGRRQLGWPLPLPPPPQQQQLGHGIVVREIVTDGRTLSGHLARHNDVVVVQLAGQMSCRKAKKEITRNKTRNKTGKLKGPAKQSEKEKEGKGKKADRYNSPDHDNLQSHFRGVWRRNSHATPTLHEQKKTYET